MRLFKTAAFFALLVFQCALSAQNPYQNGVPFASVNKIDELALKGWGKHGLKPAETCSDAVFLRRASVALIGTIPTLNETTKFLDDKAPDKRSKLVDALLKRPEFAYYWALKWCDILRVKSEFPINLWPNAVQAYQHWVWEAVRNNMPYDEFAGKLLTTSGSDFRDPPANFFRATENKSQSGYAAVAALTFMGTRLETWPESDRTEFEKLFARIAKKKTHEWKEEIVYLDPAPAEPIAARMPDGTVLKVSSDEDPRKAFADWLTRPGNPWFAQAAVNRTWFWLLGRGIVHEPDDFRLAPDPSNSFWSFSRLWGGGKKTNTGNPPTNSGLLEYLADFFVKSGYDFKALCREIVNSAVFQRSCVFPSADISSSGADIADKPGSDHGDAYVAKLKEARQECAVFPLRRLDAEVLADALSYLGGFHPKYMSVIPEPFTYIPRESRTITLADGSITSSFLVTFGRPARDSGRLLERDNQTTYAQRLFMLNSPVIHWRVSNSPFLKTVLKRAKWKPRAAVDGIYMLVLARKATPDEFRFIQQNHNDLFNSAPPMPPKVKGKKGRKARMAFKKRMKAYQKNRGRKIWQMARSLIWMLVNSKEFLFQH
ncbi:MAG: DUF1553 domain-containing protein [Kiritimatiellaeota bacterium]|nr:DUF1553 domain-containing protein [Kiritimatiellota bacterium]